MRRLPAACLLAALVTAGCARVAPSSPPQLAVPADWRTNAGPTVPISPDWWQSFGDPVLLRLIDTAQRNNFDLRLAVARIAEFQAQVDIARAAELPTIGAGITAQRSRTLGALGSPIERTTIQPQVQAAYEVDLFGRIAAQTEAARATLLATQAARDAVMLSVTASVATAYVQLRALDARLLLAQQTLLDRERALAIARSRYRSGYSSRLELAQAEAEYRATAQVVPQLRLAITRQEDALNLLLGNNPSNVPRGAPLEALEAPPIPAGLPSDLLRRRPDIAQAEQTLVAVDASLAAARAQLLPSVQLTGAGGALGLGLGNLLASPIGIWSAGGSILAPLFQGGRLRAGVDVAASRRNQALIGYERSVRTAFAEVEDALAAIVRQREQIREIEAQRTALGEALRIAHNRYINGYASFLEELDAQRNLFSAEQTLLQLRADLLASEIALYRAMGGGWPS